MTQHRTTDRPIPPAHARAVAALEQLTDALGELIADDAAAASSLAVELIDRACQELYAIRDAAADESRRRFDAAMHRSGELLAGRAEAAAR
jgi:hypothetical protein